MSDSFERTTEDRAGGRQAVERAASQSKDVAKLRQIIQHFFTKAALTVISSRITLPQCLYRGSQQIRSNRWFSLVINESEVLLDDLAPWAQNDIIEDRPSPLIIEIYLDTAELARNQSLVTIDDRGRRWDVRQALAVPVNPAVASRHVPPRETRVVLERWKISLGDSASEAIGSSADSMPNVYKKGVVLFRSLYAYSRLLPAWKFVRRIAKQPATLTSLKPLYRIAKEESFTDEKDCLNAPLYPSAEMTTQTHVFSSTKSPAGPLRIEVSYRTNCDFRIDDCEALLSSQLMGLDDHYFSPSLGRTSRPTLPFTGVNEPGSLPAARRGLRDDEDVSVAYASMSTFHNHGTASTTSPLSALGPARDMISPSLNESSLHGAPRQHSRSQSSKSSLRSADGAPTPSRRVSISFQPFKAGSLSSSPGPIGIPPSSPGANISTGLAQARGQNSSTALLHTAARGKQGQSIETNNDFRVASSPRVARYSSSFSHRRSRFPSTSGSANRAEEENSSGKTSLTSSSQPNSGLLAEGPGVSSGSAPTDDENISDFLKMLTDKKDLKSFNRTDNAAREASGRRTTAAMSKFQRLRDTHAALTDSLSSSMLLHRSSSSSSRQLSGIPPTLVDASVSTSSSPGKPISPQTPHTPAIPSRLSANAVPDELEPRRSRNRARSIRTQQNNTQDHIRGPGSGAIDIPTSPQRYPHIRRSSSASHSHHVVEDEFDMRSASMPIDDRADVSLNELMQMHGPVDNPLVSEHAHNQDHIRVSQHLASSADSTEGGAVLPRRSPFRHRLNQPANSRNAVSGGGRGSTPGLWSGGSVMSERMGRQSLGDRPGSVAVDDDEPLLFTMSDMNQSRRSLEDGRGGYGCG